MDLQNLDMNLNVRMRIRSWQIKSIGYPILFCGYAFYCQNDITTYENTYGGKTDISLSYDLYNLTSKS